jgi:catechol 2,3-dioxygenase-like lactoylglutathione lyase family enzyme
MDAKPSGKIKTLKAHVAINVRNVERSIEFYSKLFGIEPCKAYPKYAKFDVEDPPLNLTLNERPFTDQGALFHMGIQAPSTEDVLAVRERWVRAGLSTREEMQIVCGYALQDKSWVTDPDGNSWEVFVVHQDNLPTYRQAEQSVFNEDRNCNQIATACTASSCSPGEGGE